MCSIPRRENGNPKIRLMTFIGERVYQQIEHHSSIQQNTSAPSSRAAPHNVVGTALAMRATALKIFETSSMWSRWPTMAKIFSPLDLRLGLNSTRFCHFTVVP